MAREMTHCYVKIPVKPLDDIAMEKLRQLEQKLGLPLIAFSARSDEYARLSAEELAELDKLGAELDASIVAYSRGKTARPAGQSCRI
ncbi:hypothetical protein [Dehalococcoides mccartyi]|jgi:predicted alpha/beta hydrolase|uniref:hypothetical protein n=1 Tax=Dehalococcoides mccartyi TaxID=61435 RepID=UPI0003C86E13|nr:hypothetical protein [Dehalococcoides mccartyi]AHB12860.1 hypothetical protein GY50_0074 [Dehalococcoides mccartyi GY50]AII57289.1 hypothetical protein X792_00375 [Dehalococcoides mccartyi CG1]